MNTRDDSASKTHRSTDADADIGPGAVMAITRTTRTDRHAQNRKGEYKRCTALDQLSNAWFLWLPDEDGDPGVEDRDYRPKAEELWQRLVEARRALVAFEADNPDDPGLDLAWESLYIAEGSDWYWWYGLDQDSGLHHHYRQLRRTPTQVVVQIKMLCLLKLEPSKTGKRAVRLPA